MLVRPLLEGPRRVSGDFLDGMQHRAGTLGSVCGQVDAELDVVLVVAEAAEPFARCVLPRRSRYEADGPRGASSSASSMLRRRAGEKS